MAFVVSQHSSIGVHEMTFQIRRIHNLKEKQLAVAIVGQFYFIGMPQLKRELDADGRLCPS